MRSKLLHIIKTRPFFIILLCIFFVLHGYTENYDFVPVNNALLLTGLYTGVSFIIVLLGWLLFRNWTKASLLAVSMMAFHFFFGSVHDGLKKIAPNSFLVKYSFILPAAAVVLLILLIVLKKWKRPLNRITYYLNVLFLLLIAVDIVLLSGKIIAQKKKAPSLPDGFSACSTCPKPDIYFIIADEYAGNSELKDLFNFDNQAFLDSLKASRFHIISRSRSNYNYTPFSVASILNMEYLGLGGTNRDKQDLTYSYEKIRHNRLLQFLEHHGYRFYNYSVFNFDGQPARSQETFLPAKTKLITSQTLLSRLDRDIRFNLLTRWKSKKALRTFTYIDKHNNEKINELTHDIVTTKTTAPKFVYTHLMMPHYPYYYNKAGVEQPFEKLTEGNQLNKAAYVEYLQYGNTVLKELVNHILKNSPAPPVIILMGDHGFRHFSGPVANDYYFLNLASIHLPSGDYAAFNDSLTGVNFLRAFLNTQFKQQLPFLPDSTIYLKD